MWGQVYALWVKQMGAMTVDYLVVQWDVRKDVWWVVLKDDYWVLQWVDDLVGL